MDVKEVQQYAVNFTDEEKEIIDKFGNVINELITYMKENNCKVIYSSDPVNEKAYNLKVFEQILDIVKQLPNLNKIIEEVTAVEEPAKEEEVSEKVEE